jgi:hypothetical protein
MFGLVVLIVMVLYLWLLIWATRRGWRWGIEKKGWAGRKCWLGAGIGFLIVYLPVFWDFIPTVAVHQFYCAKDSGFWVYKTLDQWKAENPGVIELLVANKGAPSREERFDDGHGRADTYLLNDRFNWIVIEHDILPLLPIIMKEQQVKDVAKNEVLARYVDFGSGNSVKNFVGMPLKFWLHNGNCSGGEISKSKLIHFADDAETISIRGERK